VIGWLTGSRGSAGRSDSASASRARRTGCTSSPIRPGERSSRIGSLASDASDLIRSKTPPISLCAGPGIFLGSHQSDSAGGGSGFGSSRSELSSTAAMPSTMQ
jgi:hypothetical protein